MVAVAGVAFAALDFEAEMDEAAFDGHDGEVGRLGDEHGVDGRKASEKMARAAADDFFVADDMGPEIATEGDVSVLEGAHGDEGGGDAALHVGGAAAPEAVSRDVAGPGGVRPGARVADGDDVDVAVEGQRVPVSGAGDCRGDDGVTRRLVPALDFGAEAGEPGGDDVLAATRFVLELEIAFGLAVGAAGDELAEKDDEVVAAGVDGADVGVIREGKQRHTTEYEIE